MGVQEVHVSRINAPLVASLLVGMETMDPTGRTTPQEIAGMAASGQCFAATAPGSQAVYVMHVQNGVAWVSATKGAGPLDWGNLLLPVIEAQAKGCAAVAFQTARPGLVRKAKRQGYAVTGWILKKAIQ